MCQKCQYQKASKIVAVVVVLLVCFEFTTNVFFYKKFHLSSAIETMFSFAKKSRKTSVLPSCEMPPPNLHGPLKVHQDIYRYEDLEKHFSELDASGHFVPDNCTARFRVALIIPYRDRDLHLRVFLYNMHPVLQRQLLDYRIFIIEQSPGREFNRGMLMNIGFVEANKLYNFTCFIFHDIDLIAENDRNLYICGDSPRHMSVAIDTLKYRLPYATLFGGIVAMTKEQFVKVNGFSNQFFGWGGEDDDLYNRVQHQNMSIVRRSPQIARYKMMKHRKSNANPNSKLNNLQLESCHVQLVTLCRSILRRVRGFIEAILNHRGVLFKEKHFIYHCRHELIQFGQKRFSEDGLNSLTYVRKKLEFRKLYTWINVEINSK